jgi:hypothetical protein
MENSLMKHKFILLDWTIIYILYIIYTTINSTHYFIILTLLMSIS